MTTTTEGCQLCGHPADEHNLGPNADECSCGCSYFRQPKFSPAVESFLDGVMPTITTEGNTQ